MKRRDFLKLLGIAPAVMAAPLLANVNKQINIKVVGYYYDEGEVKSILQGAVDDPLKWESIKQSEISPESPITTTLMDSLK